MTGVNTTMSSPAKKRKITNDVKNGKPQSKGLEYFFSKQRANEGAPALAAKDSSDGGGTEHLTDEELARKLQAEWDKEAIASNNQSSSMGSSSPEKPPTTAGSSALATQDVPSSGAATERLLFAQQDEGAAKKTLSLQSAGMAEDSTTANIPLDEPPITFEPSKYVAQLKQYWDKDGGDASYALLTRCFFLVSGTTSRIKIVDTLVNCLRILIQGDPESLLPAVGESCREFDILLLLITASGLACYQLYFACVYIAGVRIGRVCHIKSFEKCLRT